ncbi:MAG TPA: T9SS type A sorting domain-containing protein [Phaeodactylibacter sp.]|nr:T9SS type A sorting domain-containing protein [Phaeodactylibacter sp.]
MSGSAFVYVWDGTSWQQTASFDGENAQDLFGAELSLSDDGHVMAVGAYLHHESVNSLGAVYVYAENGGNWVLQGEPLYGDSLSYFGGSLALSGDGQTLVVGAYSENGESGNTYVYVWDGIAWQQKGSSIAGENGERMGKGVAVNEDGTVFCTGAPFFHGYYGPNTGRAQVYAWDGSDWNQQGVDVEGMLSGNECGNAVAVSDDGSIVAIGAFHSDAGGFHSGNVRVFEICLINISLTVSGTTLTANQSNGTYQWLDCENGIPITGATSQSFTPSQSGTYAVVVTANGCVDTSACEEVIITSVLPEAFGEDFNFYPNPVGDKLYVKLGTPYAQIDVFVRDELGRLLAHEAYQQVEDFVLDMPTGKEGLYFIQVLADGRRSRVFKVQRGGL